MADGKKLPGIVVVGGIIEPKGDSFTFSWLDATEGCTRAVGDRKEMTNYIHVHHFLQKMHCQISTSVTNIGSSDSLFDQVLKSKFT